ncbi:hypothetical protein [Burkholderia ubonensis]|uniref:hypothetical protein n=1 Tax=Burkholderia ubonensis TaxID=101571 RepID=UPI0007538716|nr:hypothetical protein [Burkholderia ubonensis]KVP17267.1 hypothetical protein WJ84_03270 [Burkholderia ubonensis]
MSWKAIATAPKDVYLLGYDAAQKRPFVMLWNVPEGRFIETCSENDDAVPTYWTHLPRLPSIERTGWLPLDLAPRSGYCLGYDECLKHPFVMSWRPSKQAFVVQNGLGDETPSQCMLIPPVLELAMAA